MALAVSLGVLFSNGSFFVLDAVEEDNASATWF